MIGVARILALLLCLVALGRVFLLQGAEDNNAVAEVPAAVVFTGAARIIDGDTVEIEGRKVRLYGIDAPELHQKCLTMSGLVVPCGKIAKQIINDIIGKSLLHCEKIGTDRYRRTIARCKANNMDIGREMVRRGWAVAYRRYSRDYLHEEEKAEARGVGLWSLKFVRPRQWRKER